MRLLVILLFVSSLMGKSLISHIESDTLLPDSLLTDSIALNQMDKQRRTPLMYSAYLGKDRIVKQLISAGAPLDIVPQQYYTSNGVLNWAIHSGKLSTVKLVAEAGAPYVKECYISLPLSKEERELQRKQKRRVGTPYLGSPMNIAAYNTSEDAIAIVHYLLEKYKSDINEPERGRNGNRGYAPIQWAVVRGNEAMVDTLIALGADLNYICTEDNSTALSLALKENRESLFIHLLEKGADPAVNDRSTTVPTLLQTAVLEEKVWAVNALLDKQADINAYKAANVISVSPVAAVPTAPILSMLYGSDDITDILLNRMSSQEFFRFSGEMIRIAAGHKDIARMKQLVERDSSIVTRESALDSLVRLLIRPESALYAQYHRAKLTLPEPVVLADEEKRIIEGVQFLVAKGAVLDSLFVTRKIRYITENSILMDVVARDYDTLLSYLFSLGADKNVTVSYYDNLLHYAVSRGSFSSAKYLVQQGMPITEKAYSSLSRKALSREEFQFFYKLLKKRPDFKTTAGEYLLQSAALNGVTKEMKELLNSGVSPYITHNSKKMYETQIYTNALQSGSAVTLSTLCSMRPPSDSIRNVLTYTALKSKNEELMIPLLTACSYSDSMIVSFLTKCKRYPCANYLLENYAPLFSDSLKTRLFKGASYNPGKRRALLNAGVILNDSLCYSVLYEAVRTSDTSMMKMVIQKKLPLRVPVPRGSKGIYSLPKELMKRSDTVMLAYLCEQGVTLTPEERYYQVWQAVRTDSVKQVIALIKAGAPVENPDSSGRSTLRLATSSGAFETANYLLDTYEFSPQRIADGIVGLFTGGGERDGKNELADRLFALNPDYEQFNVSPSDLPKSCSSYRMNSFNSTYAPKIFRKGYGLNVKTMIGKTPLHEAVSMKWSDSAYAWTDSLLAWGADINSVDDSGRTPLFIAVSKTDLPTVEKLVNHGADLNARDVKGKSILTKYFFNKRGVPLVKGKWDEFYARREKLLTTLLDAGADPYGLDEKGYSQSIRLFQDSGIYYLPIFLRYWKEDVVDANGRGMLHLAAAIEKGDSALVNYIKPEFDINRQSRSYGGTPLSIASGNVNISIKPLLDAGADVSAAGNAALFRAVNANNVEAVELLLEAGADPNARNSRGETPLFSYDLKSLEIFQLFKEHGADFNLVNAKGNTLLMKMCQSGKYEKVLMLLHFGADRSVKNGNGRTAEELIGRGYGYSNNKGALKDLFNPETPLPPLEEYSRTPLLGTWLLRKREVYDEQTDTLISVQEYRKKEAPKRINVSTRQVAIEAKYPSQYAYDREGSSILLRSKRYSSKDLLFIKGEIVEKKSTRDRDRNCYVIVKDYYKKL